MGERKHAGIASRTKWPSWANNQCAKRVHALYLQAAASGEVLILTAPHNLMIGRWVVASGTMLLSHFRELTWGRAMLTPPTLTLASPIPLCDSLTDIQRRQTITRRAYTTTLHIFVNPN